MKNKIETQYVLDLIDELKTQVIREINRTKSVRQKVDGMDNAMHMYHSGRINGLNNSLNMLEDVIEENVKQEAIS